MDNILSLTELPGLNILYEHIFNSLLGQQLAHVFWKDKNGRYLGVNKGFLDDADLQSFDEAIGKTDSDLRWAEVSPMIRQHDLEVIDTGNPRKFIEFQKVDHKIKWYLCNKRPLRSRTGKIIGIYGTSIPLNNDQTPGFNPNMKDLTQRQIEYLIYLMQGKTARENC